MKLSDIATMLAFAYFFVLLVFGIYAILILYVHAGWKQTETLTIDKSYEPQTSITIIIPARNEAENLPRLLADLDAQIFPPHLFEIIVVDDHSTDATPTIAQAHPRVQWLPLAHFITPGETIAFKKKAIEIAIQHSRAAWIITLDADVRVKPWWLHSLVQTLETHKVKWLAGPVQFHPPHTWFERFQLFDFLTMQGITAALLTTHSGVMCNGANLAYSRRAYDTVNGFEGIKHLASGDDMLLMQKIEQRFPKLSLYVKQYEAIASTQYMPTLHHFIQQRIRWASKAKQFKDHRIKWILLLVLLTNILWFILPMLCWFNIMPWWFFLGLAITHIVLEWRLLRAVLVFFNAQAQAWEFILLKTLHVPYILVSAFWGMFGSYTWKDRNVH